MCWESSPVFSKRKCFCVKYIHSGISFVLGQKRVTSSKMLLMTNIFICPPQIIFIFSYYYFFSQYLKISEETHKYFSWPQNHGRSRTTAWSWLCARFSGLFVYSFSYYRAKGRYVNIISFYFYIRKMSYDTLKCNSEDVVNM